MHSAKSVFPALSRHRELRFLIVFVLYVAQGVPVGVFFFAIPAWLAANGANALEVGGYLSATSLPWTLKFVNGFLMDRFTYLPMGRRRIWLIGAQTIMVVALTLFALADPGTDNLIILSIFSFLVMLVTTYQDVAVDGMAVDLVPDSERARANGFMFGGQSIGIAAGTALTGFAIVSIGFTGAILGSAAFIAIVLLLLVGIRERPGERLLPWTQGSASENSARVQLEAWKPLVLQICKNMFTRDSGYHAVAQISVGAIYGFFVGVMPLIAVNVGGWTDAEFSGLSGLANLVAGILGVCIFGFVVDKLGSRKATIIGGCLIAALSGLFWLAKPAWEASHIIKTATLIYTSMYVALQIAICASAMKICSLKVAATQFTLFMALANLGIVIASAALGPLEASGGYGAILAAIIFCGITCAGAMCLFNEEAIRRTANVKDGHEARS